MVKIIVNTGFQLIVNSLLGNANDVPKYLGIGLGYGTFDANMTALFQEYAPLFGEVSYYGDGFIPFQRVVCKCSVGTTFTPNDTFIAVGNFTNKSGIPFSFTHIGLFDSSGASPAGYTLATPGGNLFCVVQTSGFLNIGDSIEFKIAVTF